jgi:hypothetical protein
MKPLASETKLPKTQELDSQLLDLSRELREVADSYFELVSRLLDLNRDRLQGRLKLMLDQDTFAPHSIWCGEREFTIYRDLDREELSLTVRRSGVPGVLKFCIPDGHNRWMWCLLRPTIEFGVPKTQENGFTLGGSYQIGKDREVGVDNIMFAQTAFPLLKMYFDLLRTRLEAVSKMP